MGHQSMLQNQLWLQAQLWLPSIGPSSAGCSPLGMAFLRCSFASRAWFYHPPLLWLGHLPIMVTEGNGCKL